MKKLLIVTILVSMMAPISSAMSEQIDKTSFSYQHDNFKPSLIEQVSDDTPPDVPPEGVLQLIKYPTELGDMHAYISADPQDNEKHPIIIWIAGGWDHDIGDTFWRPASSNNDQSASIFRESGVLTFYPSLRGFNGNPGYQEIFFGEIHDIISAAEYAKTLPYVDPNRVYLGGHSTGGTAVILAAEHYNGFRAVFSFGPAAAINQYDTSSFTFNLNNIQELSLRSPIYWLNDIQNPTFIFEGIDGNAASLRMIKRKLYNKQVHTYLVNKANHFSVLKPVSGLIADKILNDTDPQCNIKMTLNEVQQAFDNR